MSEINANFVVQPITAEFTVTNNNINFTPDDIQLTVYAGGLGVPGGGNTQLQYNNAGTLGGIPNITYNGTTLSLGNTTDFTINGGANNYVLTTDGLGNVSWTAGSANVANYANIAFGLNANINNTHISGGTNGYVLQTDGTGNLSWTAQTGGGGSNGLPGGSNTQIQFNDAGAFGGSAGFTFNKTSNVMSVPGNISATYFIGNGALTSLTVAGNITTTGTTGIQQAQEKVTLDSNPSTGTINFNLLDQAIVYKTANSTSNFSLNFRGNSTTTLNTLMSNGQSMTCTFMNTNGASGYYITGITIDGTTVTPKWSGGTAPTSGISFGIDAYTFNIIKTNSNVFTVLASNPGFA